MYVIVVYDVSVERVNRVHKLLKTYLFWRQNSVFEGELSKAQLYELKRRLSRIVKDEDSVLIYELPYKNFNLHVIGTDKSPVETIL
ncbi:CRISPR-associated endonuclease Cas2 [Thermococcus chitonophagus]|uniref:CRISPR-associated endoribonuclease Cas2 n=1 Tax=Thermococcus chitonophagus TaxID=54262 RepID=A0A160VTQ6_9EURY|nr:CRISPR-associated endonuclease Cas2 [Thermococcus chitonophagus]ASJ15757.1 CRISPR-associated endonuclease Cas2 [Thermococcus chitonophagus]CUX76981.1 CRISPR-associated protein Cas2 [Thermococcus chitonophagus]